jgi:hypothetical protein
MKKIWNYLRAHIRQDFNPGHYATISLFLILCLTLNYIFDFEDDYLELMSGFPKFFAYLAFYSFAYFFAVSAYAHFYKRNDLFGRKEFWFKSVFGIMILSLDSSMPFLDSVVDFFFHPHARFWAYKVLINGTSFFTVLVPIVIFYLAVDKKERHYYGLSAYKFDPSPYFLMLLIMLPLIVAASFNARFLVQYPMYKTSGAHFYLGVPESFTVVGYELAYGLDFITVEYLFRGLLVIGMMNVLGRGAVLTMAVVYCFLHFGKPAGEAISSIFGGYLLGIVAYETRSVWGGVIVHMGIAWTMELVAFVRKLAMPLDT